MCIPEIFGNAVFINTNGESAFRGIPVLLAAVQMPLDTPLMGTRAVFIAAFSRVGLMTNQIHQWAHMEVRSAASSDSANSWDHP